MVSTYYKSSHKSLGNNSFKSFQFLFMYVQPKFIPVNVLNIQITTSENIPPYRKEVFVGGDGNCFYSKEAV